MKAVIEFEFDPNDFDVIHSAINIIESISTKSDTEIYTENVCRWVKSSTSANKKGKENEE